jgi:hypothetical protein
MFESYGQFQAGSVAPSGGPGRYDPGVHALGKAVSVFQSVQFRAQLRRMWGRLTRRPRRLLDLHEVRRAETIESMFERGCVTIEVNKIRGSENRVTDFDDTFLPLKHSARERWAGIYAARACGQPLPAISVVQVGDTYYVRDGHHRVSVARLMGEEYMEAHVQVWQIKGQVAPAPAMSMQMLATF